MLGIKMYKDTHLYSKYKATETEPENDDEK